MSESFSSIFNFHKKFRKSKKPQSHPTRKFGFVAFSDLKCDHLAVTGISSTLVQVIFTVKLSLGS